MYNLLCHQNLIKKFHNKQYTAKSLYSRVPENVGSKSCKKTNTHLNNLVTGDIPSL